LLATIEEGSAIICESNSARTVVEPGVFLMIHKRGLTVIKPSARELMHLADQVVSFDKNVWDFSPELCSFDTKTWSARFAASAAILAGGQSLRMQQDKSLLTIQGQPLIAHIAKQLTPVFPEVFIGSNEKNKYAFLGLPIIADQTPGQGPLMGILSCLKAARYDRVLIVACDIPTIDISFVRQLIRLSQDADIAIPLSAGGRHEPLLAVYRKSVIPRAEALLASHKRRIVEVFDGLIVKTIDMPSGWYHNLNTPEDLDRIRDSSTK
jgi:molybdopterin-guanine dinucleotide biosynthesis protein A